MTSANYSENRQHDQTLIPYVGRLHLDQAPFTEDSSGQFFYTDPEIKQNLNLLRHLTQSSNLIPVVLSPKDGGKSSLLQAFIEESDNNSKICKIDANYSNDKSYILKEIAKCFDIDSNKDESELLHLFHKKATAFYRDSKYPVIAIENAQHLQDDACKLLLSLQQGLEDKINTWHVLFFADCISGEPPKLYNIDLSRYPQLHILLLEPYTLEQTKNYISHRLAAAGHIGDCPLTGDAINYIYLNSKGLPGKINDLAHSALLKLSAQNPDAYSDLTKNIQSSPTSNRLSFRTLFFGILIILAAGTLLYIQEDINALFSLNDQQQKPAAVKKDDNDKATVEADKKGLATKDASASAYKKPVDPMISSTPTPSEEKKPATDSDMNIKESAVTQEAPLKKTVSVTTITPTKESSISTDLPYSRIQQLLPDTVHREDWLLKQQGKYTVRLLGTFKKNIITTYLNENVIGKKFGHEISYYLTEKNGKYKYTLLYGIFPGYSHAKAAIKNLPTILKSNGPWPVKLDDIKKSITDYRESKLVNIKSPTSVTAPKVAKPKTSQPQIVTTKVTNKPSKDKAPDSFTVQLLGTSSKKPLLSYMKKYGLEDKSVLYKTTRNNKDWYVLFYGVFETRKMAESFVSNLPKDARSSGPWIRKMSDLQQGFR